MSDENVLLLKLGDIEQVCMACYSNTKFTVTCCNAPICRDCYLEWLKHKRQCMHCNADQCGFQEWMDQYRVETVLTPLEILQQVSQGEMQGMSFGDFIQMMQANTEGAQFLDPDELPDSDEEFTLEYGFMATPTDQDGNPVGPSVEFVNTIDYNPLVLPNTDHLYEQMQQALDQYLQVFQGPQIGDDGGGGGDDGDDSGGDDDGDENLPSQSPPQCEQQ